MILGFDWLERYSSMKIHWADKWLSIPYDSSTAIIQGMLSELREGAVVQVYQLYDSPVQGVDADHAPVLP
jgi:hypothetical protein